MMYRSAITITLMSAILLLLAGCGSSRSAQSQSYKPIPAKEIKGADHPAQKALLVEAERWLGTPYRYGGNDRKGVDCSGFVKRVYADALGINLPRSSREQAEYCSKVNRQELQPGDLVFFSTSKGSTRVSHVGIFMGAGQMIHASSSKGVIISHLDQDYYKRTYSGSGSVPSLRKLTASKKLTKDSGNQPKADTKAPASGSDPFTLTPSELPQRRQTPAQVKQPEKTIQTPVRSVAQIPGDSLPASDSRDRVLQELVEQKIDSIVASMPLD